MTEPARRLTVLFLPIPGRPALVKPWLDDVVRAIGDRHALRIYDAAAAAAPQFAGVDVVIDQGGAVGTPEMLDLAGTVRLWQVLGTGLDAFDLAHWRARGMPVANTPGEFSAVALGECAMMLILMLARRFPQTQEHLRRGAFYTPMGMELEGRRLAIVGFGASGRALARRARAFDMEIMAIDIREIGAAERAEFGVSVAGTPDDLDGVLAGADIVSLHLHLNAETRHILDARRIGLMRPGAFVINVARGALVDEAALEAALVAGRLGGAGLDCFGREPPDLSAPLFSLPSVVATPHIAGVTDGTSRRRAECCARNVDRLAAGLAPLHLV